jgi:hypothetical protein
MFSFKKVGEKVIIKVDFRFNILKKTEKDTLIPKNHSKMYVIIYKGRRKK